MKDTENGTGRRGSRWRMAAWSTAALLMLLPLGAMQVTDQVDWDVTDFAILGVLLATVGVILELAVRKTDSTEYRFAVGIALVAAFILIGVNGAVGIIGTEDNVANLMFAGVLAIGFIGAIIARFQPLGMARAMFATALAQVLVAVIVVIAGLGSAGPIWPWDIIISTGIFTALWPLSARLFRNVAG